MCNMLCAICYVPPTLYCAVPYIAACVDLSRTVFRDRSKMCLMKWSLIRLRYLWDNMALTDLELLPSPSIPNGLKRFRSQISLYICCSPTKCCRKVMFQSYLFVSLYFHRQGGSHHRGPQFPPPPTHTHTCLKLFNFSTRTSLSKDPTPRSCSNIFIMKHDWHPTGMLSCLWRC